MRPSTNPQPLAERGAFTRAWDRAYAFAWRQLGRLSFGTGLLAPIVSRLRPPRAPAPAPVPGPAAPAVAARAVPQRVRLERAEDFTELLDRPAMAVPDRPRPLVALAIGSLSAGGAERQLAAFVASPRAQERIEPVVVLSFEPTGAHGHYADTVRRAGVRIEVARNAGVEPDLRGADRDLAALLDRLPDVIRAHVTTMAEVYLRLKPDCVHAWLDHQNIWSGVAALAVGTPHVVLSTRNVNPTHFPYLSQPWFVDWYRLLLRSPRVSMINNSRPGADDYAAWLGYPREKVRVVLNGVDPAWIQRPADPEIAALRHRLAAGRPLLVGGVFRLSEEKQPFAWLEVARRIAAARGDVAFFHAGEGPLHEAFCAQGADLIASGRLHVLGRRSDVPALLAASDALLHTARFEGTPNVLLEASHLGCPIVATRAGGSIDVVADGETGFLRDPSDTDGLTSALAQVLADNALRRRFATAGPRRIAEEFSLDAMVEGTLAAYPMLPTRVAN